MTKNESLQKALDALGPIPPDCCGCQTEWQIAITAVKAALEAKDEPVAWVYPEFWQHLENLNCGTAYRLTGIGRQPLYTTPPQRKPCGLECDCTDVCKQDDYKALWQQMCERCDELDKKLAQQEHGWTPERIAGMARLKAQQDKRLEPQRTWIELNDEDYIKALELCDFDKDAAFDFFEAKLKELNT